MKKKIFAIVLAALTVFMTIGMASCAMTSEKNADTEKPPAIESSDAPMVLPEEDEKQNEETEAEAEDQVAEVEEGEENQASEVEIKDEEEAPEAETEDEDEWVIQNRVIPDVIPEFDEDSMTVYTAEEALKKIPFPTSYLPTYRSVYYWSPTYLVDLVDRDEFHKWGKEVIVPDIENNIEPQEMYTVAFIKYFKISKEDFERAEERRRLRFEELHEVNGDDISTETYEIYNADIIYTFDNEIINNYYRRNK